MKNSRIVTSVVFAVCAFCLPALVLGQQTTLEVCRETKKVLDQYEAERKGPQLTLRVKQREADFRDDLSELRRAIAGGFVVSGLSGMAGYFSLGLPNGTKARLELQKTVRNMLQTELQKAANSTEEELQAQLDRISQQISTRQDRFYGLDCDEVLAREESPCNGFDGTWKTSFGEMTFNITGNIATASYSFDSGTVTGRLSERGRVLSGTYSENEAKGTFAFTLAADGRSFTGKWRRTSGRRLPPSGIWEGKCVRR